LLPPPPPPRNFRRKNKKEAKPVTASPLFVQFN
jgi:hypothetical protein